jgi:hypothetical protein
MTLFYKCRIEYEFYKCRIEKITNLFSQIIALKSRFDPREHASGVPKVNK